RRPSRSGSSEVWRSRQNDFPIIGRDQLNPWPAWSAVIDKVLAVSLRCSCVLLVVDVPAEFLFEPGRDGYKRCHPVWLGRLARRNHIEPGAEHTACITVGRTRHAITVGITRRRRAKNVGITGRALGVRIDR